MKATPQKVKYSKSYLGNSHTYAVSDTLLSCNKQILEIISGGIWLKRIPYIMKNNTNPLFNNLRYFISLKRHKMGIQIINISPWNTTFYMFKLLNKIL